MKIPKPTEADKETFRHLVPEGVEVKPMFGNLAAFVNGNMVMGLFGREIGLRLSEEDRAELRKTRGTGDFGPEDRPMKEYVTIPKSWRNDPKKAAAWINRSLDYVSVMPPKIKKVKNK